MSKRRVFTSRDRTLLIDYAAREVVMGSDTVELTKLEFDILELLSRSTSVVFTRGMILQSLWSDSWFGDDHTVDVHLSNLRRKLGEDGQRPSFLHTVRGVGYKFKADDWHDPDDDVDVVKGRLAPDLTLVRISPTVEQLLGWKPEQVLGTRKLLGSPTTLDQVVAQLAAMAEVGLLEFSQRFLAMTATGQRRWVDAYVTVMLAPSGDIAYYDFEARPAPAQFEGLDPLQAEAARDLVAAGADLVMLEDDEGRITWVSDSVTEQLGWLPAELPGQPASVLVHPDDLSLTASLTPADAAHPQQVLLERRRLRRKDGTWLEASTMVRAVMDGDGSATGTATGHRFNT